MANEDQWQKVVKITSLIIVIIAMVFVLKTLKGIFIPLVVSIFVTYLFAPVVELLAKVKIPRIVTLFILMGIISLIGVFGAQIIVNNVKDFIDYWPSLEKELFVSLGTFFEKYLSLETSSFFNIIESARIQEFLSSAFNISLSFIGKLFLTILLLIFIYISYHNYPGLIKKAFDEKRADYIFNIVTSINNQIIRFIFIKTLISAGTGILTGIACWVLGIKFAVLWGFFAFLLNYIPYIGSIVAVILPIILSFMQFPHSIIPYITIIILLGIQIFIGSFLDPEIMGNRFNLSPIIILVSLFFWGYMWGIVGAFLAVPITAIIKIVIQNIDTFKPIAVLISKKVD